MKNIIEINGRQYDAITGKLLNGNSINKPSDIQRHSSSPIKSSGRNIDGVNRNKANQTIAKSDVSKDSHVVTKDKQISQAKQQNTVKVVDGLRKKPQKAVTLSRKFVKKPKPMTTSAAVTVKSNPTDPISSQANKQDAYTRFAVFKKVPEAKIAKAISYKTSSAISKFSKTPTVQKTIVSSSLPVAKEPESQNGHNSTALAQQPTPTVEPKQSVFEHHIAQPVSKEKASNADGVKSHHIKPYHKKTHSKVRSRRYLAGMAAAVFAAFLFMGFLAYQKVPQIAVKVAARNAGFDAKVPGNIPSGYAYKSPVSASKDSLTIEYKSNTDKRAFQITQKPSNWTSESLLSNYLIEGKKQYQAYYNKGMTVFIYDNNNATWVDKGVWFTLNANGSLSSDQILSIASSI